MHDKQDGGFPDELHSGRHLTRSTSTREPALDFAQRPPQLETFSCEFRFRPFDLPARATSEDAA